MDETHQTVERRTVLRGVAISAAAVVASPVIAACGSDDEPASQPTPTPSETTPDGGAAEVLVVTSEVPEGGGVILDSEEVVVTQPSAGTFVAFSSICTHEQCPVADVAGGTINCDCHGSKFSIEDGAVVNGPATEPLPPVEVTVDGDSVVRA